MNIINVVEHIDDAQALGKNADIGDKAGVVHELRSRYTWIMTDHRELSPGIAQTNQRLQHRRLTGAVRSNQSTNRAFRDIKINTVESNESAIGLAQLACTNGTLGETSIA